MKLGKKLLSLVLAVAMLGAASAPAFAKLYLSNTTQINNANGTTRYAKATNAEYHTLKDYSLHFYSDGSLWIETYLHSTESVPAGEYTVSWEAKGIAEGDVLYFYFQDWVTCTHSGVASKESLGDGWTRYTATVNNSSSGDTNFFFHNEGKTKDCYIDNVRVIGANGKNYVVDGGYDEVIYTNGEATFTSNVWTNQSNNVNYVEPYLDGEDIGEGYSLHFYAEGDGTGLEFVQSYTNALPAGEYTLTWYAKGKGTMFFYSGWGEFAAGEVNSNEWTKFTKTLNIDGDGDTYFLFTHDRNTAIDCYFDHVSLVDGYGVNYIKDGGFDEISEPVLSNTTQINNANGTTRYAKATNAEYHTLKDYSLHFYSDGSLWIETYLHSTESVPAGEYTVSWEAKGIAEGDVLYFYFQDWVTCTHSGVAGKESLGDGWTRYTATVNNASSGDTNFFFHNEGKTKDCYIDNVRVIGANGKNYVVDGGYDEVIYTNGEAAFTSNVWTNQSNNVNYVEPYLDGEDIGEGYSLHFYAEGDGAGLEFVQSYTNDLPAGEYTLTWYAKGKGTMFFYSGWGEFAAAEVNSNEWTKFTKTLNIDGDGDTYFLFTHDAKSAIDCYFDHISLVDGNGVNYVKDGGFDEFIKGTPVEEVETIKYTIAEPEFVGENGNVITSIESGTVEVRTKITNYGMGDNFNPVVIVAMYDGAELIGMTYTQMQIVESINDFGDEICLTVAVPEKAGDYKLKVMYWDGFDTIAPLGNTDILD